MTALMMRKLKNGTKSITKDTVEKNLCAKESFKYQMQARFHGKRDNLTAFKENSGCVGEEEHSHLKVGTYLSPSLQHEHL